MDGSKRTSVGLHERKCSYFYSLYGIVTVESDTGCREICMLGEWHGRKRPKWRGCRLRRFGVVHHNIEVIKWNRRTTTTSSSRRPPTARAVAHAARCRRSIPSYPDTVSHALESGLCHETPESHLQPLRSRSSRRGATISPVVTVARAVQIAS